MISISNRANIPNILAFAAWKYNIYIIDDFNYEPGFANIVF